MLNSEFWIKQSACDVEKKLVNHDELKRFREETAERMKDLGLAAEYTLFQDMKEKLSRQELKDMMSNYSLPDNIPEDKLYGFDKNLHPRGWKEQLIEEANLDNIPEEVVAQPALTTDRALIRAFPSNDTAARSRDTIDVDLFQLTALPAACPVQVWHYSRSGDWAYVQSEIYSGWMEKKYLALAENREEVIEYIENDDFLVVKESHLQTEPNPFYPEVSNIQLQMGDTLPLMDSEKLPSEIPAGSTNGQSPAGCYPVKVPVADKDGRLNFAPALIPGSARVQRGYVKLNRRNLIKAAFACLGERYGWGGLFNRRDCSRLIFDIYRLAGLVIPRDAGDPQEEGAAGRKIYFEGSREERLRQLQKLAPGDPLYLPGHVMVYLGEFQGKHYVIHAGAGYGRKEENKVKSVTVHSVFVMELETLMQNKDKTYLEALTVGCKFYQF